VISSATLGRLAKVRRGCDTPWMRLPYGLRVGFGSIALFVACGGVDEPTTFHDDLEDSGSADASNAAASGGAAGDGGGTGGRTASGGRTGSGGGGGSDDGGSSGGRATVEPDGGPPGDGSVDSGDAGSDASCPESSVLFADVDGDGFGNPDEPRDSCEGGRVSANGDDCYDENADAKPGQEGFFPEHRGDGSFDYDCDGDETVESKAIGVCSIAICGALTEGWQTSVPPCGDQHPWLTTCTGLAICTPETEFRFQGCR
jgi:hypothetical protein